MKLIQVQGATQTELADSLEIGKAALGMTLQRLERKGWIERRPDPTDSRVRRVYLTRKCGAVADRLLRFGEEMHEDAMKGLSACEREALIDALVLVRRNLAERQRREIPARSRRPAANRTARG